MTCNICCEKYNKTLNAKVTCICGFVACKTCVRTYLLSTTKDPQQDKVYSNRNKTKQTFDMLKEADQQNIINRVDQAYKLFKDDGDGRVGYINQWMDEFYPNVPYNEKQFYTNRDLTVAESIVNDTQLDTSRVDDEIARDVLLGKVGYDNEANRYLFNESLLEADKDFLLKKSKEDLKPFFISIKEGGGLIILLSKIYF